METKKLLRCFNSEFDISSWKGVLTALFANVELYKTAIDTVDKNLQKHSIAKSIKDFGNARLADNRLIRFYEVELEKEHSVANSRVGLRNLIHTEINPGDTDAILAVYHSVKENLWRLTFISKSIYWDDDFNEQRDETHPKRYTYVLGPEETTKTAVSQFEKLFENTITIKSLIDAFNVEKLSKEFFKQYVIQYKKFWQYIAENEEYRRFLIDRSKKKIEDQEKPIRDFTKKLLGRIVFLYFLQKKGWMGCPKDSTKWENGEKQFLLKLFEDFPDKEHFHSKCLTDLFFNTLNRKSEVFKHTDTKVPYLNGGLFEEDKPKETKEIDFPSSYFKELFDFFGQYNFTIDENNPDDHEVGIDPEMLGHIFESLLEDNRSKGAFYTPKAIVQYMTQESLIQYLKTHLGDHQEIEDFIRYGSKGDEEAKDNFIRKNATEIENLLDKVKVCDPAIGSGAFPMGILNEIFKAKLSLDWTLDRAEAKKSIIQNSIYGVDLESGAVDIARLRFWLSLVVDEDEPQPLPNLDFKIMQGNSLLESFEGVDLSEIHEGKSFDVQIINSQMDIFSGQEKKKVSQSLNFEKIEDLLKDYFSLDSPEVKAITHKKIDKHVLDHIHFTLEDHKIDLQKRAKPLNKKIKEKSASLSSGIQKVKYETESTDAKKLKKINEELNNITTKEIKLNQLYQSNERPFFLWHLFFKEVFDEGGFDIVIGNPPYIQLQSNQGKLVKELSNEGYQTLASTGDIYALFYEKGVQILKPGGILSFITSSQWMKAGYGKKLRTYFSALNPLKLIDLGPNIFKTATVHSNIMILENDENKKELLAGYAEDEKEFRKLDVENLAPMLSIDEEIWTILSPSESDIINTIKEKGKVLEKWQVKINFGVKTGYNEAFVINQEKRDKLIAADQKNNEIIKPVVRGREIQRYLLESKSEYIIFIPWHFPLKETVKGASKEAETQLKERYPVLYDYLLKHKESLSKRNKAETGIRYEWYALQRCASTYFKEFAKPKIIWKRIGSIMRFSYSNEGEVCLDSTCIATGEKIPYLTAVLNSKLMLYYLDKSSPKTGTGDNIISVQALNPLPVYYPDNITEQLFENLFWMIIYLKTSENAIIDDIKNAHIIRFFETVIDGCVFELYFKEHMIQREVNITDLVNKELSILISNKSFQEFDNDHQREIIKKFYDQISYPDHSVRNRILKFPILSPDILKPILKA